MLSLISGILFFVAGILSVGIFLVDKPIKRRWVPIAQITLNFLLSIACLVEYLK